MFDCFTFNHGLPKPIVVLCVSVSANNITEQYLNFIRVMGALLQKVRGDTNEISTLFRKCKSNVRVPR